MSVTAEKYECRLYAATVTKPETWGKPSTPGQARESAPPSAYCLVVAPQGWQIIGEILLTVEQDEDGTYLATDSFSTVYGEGTTPEHSINDYWESLTNCYEILKANVASNRQTALVFRRLRRRLVKKPR